MACGCAGRAEKLEKFIQKRKIPAPKIVRRFLRRKAASGEVMRVAVRTPR